MQVEVFTLCDAATDTFGKLNILGAFDTITAHKVPVVHRQCAIALRLRFRRVEGSLHRLALAFVDEDGQNVLPPLNTQITVPFGEHDLTRAVNFILNLQNLTLQSFGEYAIELAVDGRLEASLPLYVRPATQKEQET
ncbi:MAG: hypothetical protein D6802_12715 [Ardenticatenia bacterium]|nr:MAG: hypothetical protein D6802_12715 [Ardenticatenia bacterium]